MIGIFDSSKVDLQSCAANDVKGEIHGLLLKLEDISPRAVWSSLLLELTDKNINLLKDSRHEGHDVAGAEARIEPRAPELPLAALERDEVPVVAEGTQEVSDHVALWQGLCLRKLRRDGRVDGEADGIARWPDVEVDDAGRRLEVRKVLLVALHDLDLEHGDVQVRREVLAELDNVRDVAEEPGVRHDGLCPALRISREDLVFFVLL